MAFRESFLPLSLLLVCSLPFAVACGDDDPTPPGNNDGSGDGSGDIDPACEGSASPDANAACSCEGTSAVSVEDLCTTNCTCTGGFWTCGEPTCEEVTEPELMFSGDAGLQEVTGNGNGVPNPGETWSVSGNVIIADATEAQTVTVRLRSLSTKLDVAEASEDLADIGATAVPFTLEFMILPTATEGSAPLTLEAFTAGGFDLIEDELELTVATVPTPVLTFSAGSPTETTGNGDRFLDYGEEWSMPVTLRNTGDAVAEGIAVEATPSGASLTDVSVSGAPATLAATGSAEVLVAFTISDDPSDFSPTLSITATSDNAETISTVEAVTIRPIDTLSFVSSLVEQVEGEGNDDAIADNGEDWQLVITLENTGTAALEITEWRLNNYFIPDLPGDGSGSGDGSGEGSGEGSGGEPDYTDLKFELADGTPTSIPGGSEIEVFATTTIDETMGDIGRVILTVQSSLRRHGPFAVDVPLARQ